jgi:hypothetical protein
MTPEARAALREKVAKKLCQEKCAFYGEPPCWGLDPNEYVIEPWNPDTCDEPGCGALASAAIDMVLEEAARVADASALEAWDFGADETRGLMRLQAADIAAAIRAMKGKATSPESGAPDADQSPATR